MLELVLHEVEENGTRHADTDGYAEGAEKDRHCSCVYDISVVGMGLDRVVQGVYRETVAYTIEQKNDCPDSGWSGKIEDES